MDRAGLNELVGQALMNIAQYDKNGQLHEDVRQVAYAMFLITNDEEWLDTFGIALEDCLTEEEHEPESKPDSEYIEPKKKEGFGGPIILGQNQDTVDPFNIPTTIEPLLPPPGHKRVNKFKDYGTVVEKDDALIDSKIKRPTYRPNRRARADSYMKQMRCTQCNREDEVDSRTIFKGSYQYEHGYHCPKCMRNLVSRR